MLAAATILIAYLLGSIPFGYLIVRATQDADIRETGSGGTGATNVSRRAGKFAGIATLLLDLLKGAAAVLIASWIMKSGYVSWWLTAAGVAVVLGHMFPVWLSFRGGKGVATGVGVFAVLAPIALVPAAVILVAIVWLTRYVSLGSMLGAVTIPIVLWLRNAPLPILTASSVIAILIVFAHRQNIARLISGTENKFK
jgi:glycerol-3-phosphate acyltransferase PlsY